MNRLRYTIPNSFTSLSLLLGIASIVTSQIGELELAAWIIVWCGLLDVLDGLSARLLKATSDFGAEFDSMADLVSFGVAPAGTCRWTNCFCSMLDAFSLSLRKPLI